MSRQDDIVVTWADFRRWFFISTAVGLTIGWTVGSLNHSLFARKLESHYPGENRGLVLETGLEMPRQTLDTVAAVFNRRGRLDGYSSWQCLILASLLRYGGTP